MKYIVTYETSCKYDRFYMIAGICSKPGTADKKVVALKKKLTKEYGAQKTALSHVLQTIKVTPWDGNSPLRSFTFLY